MDNDPQYRTGDGSAVRIWKDTAKNTFLSEKHGRPIHDEVTYVEVISPGSQGSTPVFEVKRTFAAEMEHPEPLYGMKYADFKDMVDAFEKQEEADANMVGTPLKEWSEISRTMAASLKASNVFSVEALASLPDEKLTVVGPDGRTWREKAKAWLEASKDSAVATRYAAENENLRTELAATKDQLTAMASQIEELQKQAAAGTAEKPTTEAKPAKGDKLPSIV